MLEKFYFLSCMARGRKSLSYVHEKQKGLILIENAVFQ